MKMIDLRDLALRAFHTWWQTFAGLVGVWWIASGLDAAHQITDVASAKRFALSALGAFCAAALSAVKSTLKGLAAAMQPSAILETADPHPDDIVGDQVDGPITSAQATAADPNQPSAGAPPEHVAAAHTRRGAKHESS